MATARDLITTALKLLRVLGTDQTPSSADAEDGLARLNSLLDQWSVERLQVYAITDTGYSWAGALASKTIGSGGDINTTRPIAYEPGYSTVSGEDYPYRLITPDVYARIGDKDERGIAPSWVYVDMAYPLSTIKVWPVPQSTITLHLMTWTALQSFSTLDTALALPPGYQRCLEYNLAVDLAPLFGASPSPYIASEAIRIKRVLAALNYRPPVAGTEIGSIGTLGMPGWNILAGA